MGILLTNIPKGFNERIAVVHSIDEPLSSLTVEDICQRNNLSKTQFYNLFPSKKSIGDWFFDFCFAMTLDEIGRRQTWKEGVGGFIELVDSERTFYRLFHSDIDQDRPLSNLRREQARIDCIRETLTQHDVKISAELDFQIETYVRIEGIITRLWARRDNLSCEQFLDVWLQSIPDELKEKLELKS